MCIFIQGLNGIQRELMSLQLLCFTLVGAHQWLELVQYSMKETGKGELISFLCLKFQLTVSANYGEVSLQ